MIFKIAHIKFKYFTLQNKFFTIQNNFSLFKKTLHTLKKLFTYGTLQKNSFTFQKNCFTLQEKLFTLQNKTNALLNFHTYYSGFGSSLLVTLVSLQLSHHFLFFSVSFLITSTFDFPFSYQFFKWSRVSCFVYFPQNFCH